MGAVGNRFDALILSAAGERSVDTALHALAASRDHGSGDHIDQVRRYCRLLAEAMRRQPEFARVIDEAYLADLDRATPLHDLGKIGIPDSVLLKPGRLSPGEIALMRTHCRIGAEFIRGVIAVTPSATFLSMALDIAASHHEWFDGGGYPQGLAGDAIPLAARIVALADVYDALRMRRTYKPAMSHFEARRIIVGSWGRQFDPRVVAAFLDVEQQFMAESVHDVQPSNGLQRPAYIFS